MHFSPEERATLHNIIFSRRDVRREFLPTPIPDDVIQRILSAAHHAPSVGFMQPWDFIVIKSDHTKEQIKQGFLAANEKSAKMFDEQREQHYRQLKLEGIEEAPLGICITCDRRRTGDVVLGRTIKPEMDLFSAVCAVQNLWLAARAENLGMGWVSILEDEVLYEALNIPRELDIIGYFCIGYVEQFQTTPDLERHGWQDRRPLQDAIHYEAWQPK
ncbi:5,6-dimethylbenzimidazole synthase [Marinomonas ostreistagni]|uniref:5,6-dimethylbenzimidazole synthase n=1 Tax=Marinomonas ostreistagni TaxID=359209 RepID=UPI001951DC19|nr:5,6-dimethylbenzimidazole synthase [Marinomonas ostreistagni]MBM6549618.1 5,6-dimethylbenzimidazole synthase [Marinomonas ostreistagni]